MFYTPPKRSIPDDDINSVKTELTPIVLHVPANGGRTASVKILPEGKSGGIVKQVNDYMKSLLPTKVLDAERGIEFTLNAAEKELEEELSQIPDKTSCKFKIVQYTIWMCRFWHYFLLTLLACVAIYNIATSFHHHWGNEVHLTLPKHDEQLSNNVLWHVKPVNWSEFKKNQTREPLDVTDNRIDKNYKTDHL
jgi:hypothetical protein